MITEQTITNNWDRFTIILKDAEKNNDRWKPLVKFYDTNATRIALMPASSKTSYHSAFPGGYVHHILNVYDCAFKVKKIWEESGAIIDFADDELIFTALNHDLGKFGTISDEAYIDQDSDWHSKRGEVYKHNPAVPFMKVNHRSLFILQELGVKMTENEYITILIHDGLYEEGNKSYFINFSPEYKLRSNLPYIIHQGDLMAARIEGDLLKKPTKSNNQRIIPDVPKNDRQPLNEGVSVKPKSSNNLLKKFLSV